MSAAAARATPPLNVETPSRQPCFELRRLRGSVDAFSAWEVNLTNARVSSHLDCSPAATKWPGSRDSSRRRRRRLIFPTSLRMPGVAGLGGRKDPSTRCGRFTWWPTDASDRRASQQAWGFWSRVYFYASRYGRLRRTMVTTPGPPVNLFESPTASLPPCRERLQHDEPFEHVLPCCSTVG